MIVKSDFNNLVEAFILEKIKFSNISPSAENRYRKEMIIFFDNLSEQMTGCKTNGIEFTDITLEIITSHFNRYTYTNRHTSTIASFFKYLNKTNIFNNHFYDNIGMGNREYVKPGFTTTSDNVDRFLKNAMDITSLSESLIISLILSLGLKIEDIINLSVFDYDTIDTGLLHTKSKGLIDPNTDKRTYDLLNEYCHNERYNMNTSSDRMFLFNDKPMCAKTIRGIFTKCVPDGMNHQEFTIEAMRNRIVVDTFMKHRDIIEIHRYLGYKELRFTASLLENILIYLHGDDAIDIIFPK